MNQNSDFHFAIKGNDDIFVNFRGGQVIKICNQKSEIKNINDDEFKNKLFCLIFYSFDSENQKICYKKLSYSQIITFLTYYSEFGNDTKPKLLSDLIQNKFNINNHYWAIIVGGKIIEKKGEIINLDVVLGESESYFISRTEIHCCSSPRTTVEELKFPLTPRSKELMVKKASVFTDREQKMTKGDIVKENNKILFYNGSELIDSETTDDYYSIPFFLKIPEFTPNYWDRSSDRSCDLSGWLRFYDVKNLDLYLADVMLSDIDQNLEVYVYYDLNSGYYLIQIDKDSVGQHDKDMKNFLNNGRCLTTDFLYSQLDRKMIESIKKIVDWDRTVVIASSVDKSE